jgi:hypothetical protein
MMELLLISTSMIGSTDLNGNLSIAAVVITVCLWEIRSGSNTAPAG